MIAVSCRNRAISPEQDTYADEVRAGRVVSVHIPGPLSAAEIRGLAEATAAAVAEENRTRPPAHLLVAGPCALAVLIGAATNAAGVVCDAVLEWKSLRLPAQARVALSDLA